MVKTASAPRPALRRRGENPIASLTWPIFIELLLQMLVGNADQIMVGWYDPNSVGAIGNANQITNLLLIVFSVVCTAATILISQYIGAEDTRRVNETYAVSLLVNGLFGLDPLASGILLTVLVAVVVIGGVKRIGQVTSLLVPFMSVFYVAAGIVVILMRITDIPGVFAAIFSSAFSFEAVGGGVFGYAIMIAMKNGFARGVFSNEAGLGSAPIAHAASSTEEPAEQAIWGVFEVFFDTIVICSITAFTVLLSGFKLGEAALEGYASKGSAAVAAFNSILPGTLGGTIIQASLIFFALSTILSWSYYGERCWGYLSRDNRVVTSVYKVIFVLFCVVGAAGSGQLMWDISDTLNGAMAIPNLIGLLLLTPVVLKLVRDDEKKLEEELKRNQGSSRNWRELLAGNLAWEVNAKDKADAISQICSVLMEKGYVSADFEEKLLQREALTPTSIGNRTAVPHVFDEHVRKEFIAVIRLRHRILWDGKEQADLLLVVAASPGRILDASGFLLDCKELYSRDGKIFK